MLSTNLFLKIYDIFQDHLERKLQLIFFKDINNNNYSPSSLPSLSGQIRVDSQYNKYIQKWLQMKKRDFDRYIQSNHAYILSQTGSKIFHYKISSIAKYQKFKLFLLTRRHLIIQSKGQLAINKTPNITIADVKDFLSRNNNNVVQLHVESMVMQHIFRRKCRLERFPTLDDILEQVKVEDLIDLYFDCIKSSHMYIELHSEHYQHGAHKRLGSENSGNNHINSNRLSHESSLQNYINDNSTAGSICYSSPRQKNCNENLEFSPHESSYTQLEESHHNLYSEPHPPEHPRRSNVVPMTDRRKNSSTSVKQ
jgi:hypothetical protein